MRRSIDAHGNQKTAILLVITVLFLVLLAPGWVLAQDKQKEKPMNTPVSYRTVQVDDLSIFYREAGPKEPGLGETWNPRRAFWADRATYEATLRPNLLSLATTRTRHVGNDPQVERYDPDLWTDEFRFLSQPGQADIQSDLFYDYQSNVASYPQWQEWMRQTQPRLLVLWGMYERSFDDSEPEAFRRNVPQAQVYRVDGGHFALDTAADEIANLVDSFLTGSR